MLTAKQIENLKPGPTRREFADERGLYFILQPSGQASWAVRYRVAGRPRKFTLGAWPAISLKTARELANRAMVAIAEGRDPGAEKVAARRAVQFPADHDAIEKVVEAFIAVHAKRNLKASSAAEVERLLGKEIVALWRGRRLSEIKRPDVHRLLDSIVARGAPVTANRVLAWFRRLCSWAVERGLIEASPCAGIKPPSEEKSRERILTDVELKAVWQAAEAAGWPSGLMVQLLILTGQRRSEVAEMRWGELDLDVAAWALPRERVKNGREHRVPLSAAAAKILERLPRIDGSEFVFTSTGAKPLGGYAAIKHRLDDLLPAEIAPWTLHDLRRTFASGLARLGTPIHVVEKLLNHVGGSLSGVAAIYNRHEYRDEQRAAIEAWARHVDSLVSGE